MSQRVDELSFEEAVVRLEEIISGMESGSLTLDESLSRFEQAVSLSRFCAAKLEAAEERISVLTAEEGLQPAVGLSWVSPVGANGVAEEE